MRRIKTTLRLLWALPWLLVFAVGRALTVLASLACGQIRDARRMIRDFWY